MQLTVNEELELRYAKAIGYNFIARDKGNDVFAYKIMPERDTSSFEAVDYEYFPFSIDGYDFLKWEDEPMEIEKLLRDNGKNIKLIEPSEQDISLL